MKWNPMKAKSKYRRPRVEFADGITYACNSASLLFTPTAWAKMCTLVAACQTEIAWNGLTKKITDRKYLVYDILTFPQYVSGGATTTDQQEYQKWLFSENGLDDPINFHGHSQVYFDAFRSGRDAVYQSDVIKNLGDKDYFIFFILNKKGDFHVTIVNKELGTAWDTDHNKIEVGVSGMALFAKEAMAKCRRMSQLPPQAQLADDEFPAPDAGVDELDEEMLEEFTKNDPWARNEV